MSKDRENSNTPQRANADKTVVVSMDRFSTIPQRRRRYVAMYLAMMAMWVVTTVVGVRTQARNEEAAATKTVAEKATSESETASETVAEETTPENETAAPSEEEETTSPVTGDFTETKKSLLEKRPIIYLQVATGACMVLFYLNFIGVMHTMGYPAIMILGICLACFFPLPGLLVVAAVDRRVSKAWHAALPDSD